MRMKAALGCAAILFAAMPATVAVADTTSMLALYSETACDQAPGPPQPKAAIAGHISGSVPTVGLGVFFLYTGGPGSGSIVVRGSLDFDSPVLACVEVPTDWAQEDPIETDLVPEPGSPVAGRARFAAVPTVDYGLRLEVAVVTWPATGLTSSDDDPLCRNLGRADALMEGLAALGLRNHWTTVTPDGVRLGLAWSDDHRILGRTVGDDPVRQLAVEATYEGDSIEDDTMIRGRWTTDDLVFGLDVMEALIFRWFKSEPDPFGPDAWPGPIVVDGLTTVGEYGVSLREEGLAIEFRVEPEDVSSASPDSCVL